MSVKDSQLFLQTGARLLFNRDPENTDKVIDLGTITAVGLNYAATENKLKDPYGGTLLTVDTCLAEIEESYDFTATNFNNENLALIFGGNAPSEFTQSATPETGVVHVGSVGYLFHVHNDDGVNVYRIASIQEIRVTSSPAVTLIAGEDYEIANADQGTIRLLAGGNTNDLTLSDELTMEVDYTLTAISGIRLILPQTAGIVQGYGEVHFLGNQRTQHHVRSADMSLMVTAAALQANDFSNFTLRATILSDPVDLVQPAGRLVHIKGTLPDPS